MDQTNFNAVTQFLTGIPSRRDVLRGLVSVGLGFGSLRLLDDVEAKNKNKQKKKKGKEKKNKPQPQQLPDAQLPTPLVFNEYGCIEVGQACRGDSALCCSGTCSSAPPAEGQPDQSRCVAHGTGSCKQEGEGICTAANPAGLKCNNNVNCACIQTTAGSNFCYDGRADQANNICAECSKDADCVALGYPPGSACAPISTGICAGTCATGMACLKPCGAEPPAP